MCNSAWVILAEKGVNVTRSLVGNYVTSLELAGCSLSITMMGDEMKLLWDARALTAGLRKGM